ncbi:unnamed protein product [Lupinus luteus]|uniref:Uncharacterized protein n=1 Tax=Lupinus luteus TaxID=3873 RepID=A0AAV1XDN6_LUPLU
MNDLRFMYAVKNNVMINWPEEILKVMYSVSTSQSKLLPHNIFISRVVGYFHIDVSYTIIVEYTDKDHLIGESLIHKMGIYKFGNTWNFTHLLLHFFIFISLASILHLFLLLSRFFIFFIFYLRRKLVKSSKFFASNPTSIAEIHLQSLKSTSFVEIPSESSFIRSNRPKSNFAWLTRNGSHLWGFETYGVVPNIVTMVKYALLGK